MAKPGGILALMAGPKSKGSADSLPGESAGPGSPLHDKAVALESMWKNMKAGDFDSAAMDFQEAYDLCAAAHADAEAEDEITPRFGDEAEEEEL